MLARQSRICAFSLASNYQLLLHFQLISRNSGHYQPGDDSLERFLSFLREHGVNLVGVQVTISSHPIMISCMTNQIFSKKKCMTCQIYAFTGLSGLKYKLDSCTVVSRKSKILKS